MKVLILLLPMLVCIGIGYLLGVRAGQEKKRQRVAKDTELLRLRSLKNHLYMEAGTHIALDDPFAVIVMDEINASDRMLEREGS